MTMKHTKITQRMEACIVNINALNYYTVSDIFLATLMVWRLLNRCLVTAPETLISDTLQEHTWQIILTDLLP